MGSALPEPLPLASTWTKVGDGCCPVLDQNNQPQTYLFDDNLPNCGETEYCGDKCQAKAEELGGAYVFFWQSGNWCTVLAEGTCPYVVYGGHCDPHERGHNPVATWTNLQLHYVFFKSAFNLVPQPPWGVCESPPPPPPPPQYQQTVIRSLQQHPAQDGVAVSETIPAAYFNQYVIYKHYMLVEKPDKTMMGGLDKLWAACEGDKLCAGFSYDSPSGDYPLNFDPVPFHFYNEKGETLSKVYKQGTAAFIRRQMPNPPNSQDVMVI